MFFCVYYLIRICNLDLEKFDKIFSVAARVKRLLHSFVGSSNVQQLISNLQKVPLRKLLFAGKVVCHAAATMMVAQAN